MQLPKNIKAIMFDFDGTLINSFSGAVCANTESDMFIMPNVAEVISDLRRNNILLFIATNQGGVSCEFKREAVVWSTLLTANTLLGSSFEDIKVNFFHENGKLKARYIDRAKPKPSMIQEVMADFGFDPVDCMYVGDGYTDEIAALAGGVTFAWAHDFFNWPKSYIKKDHFGYAVGKEHLDELRCFLKKGPCMLLKVSNNTYARFDFVKDYSNFNYLIWGNENEQSVHVESGYSSPPIE